MVSETQSSSCPTLEDLDQFVATGSSDECINQHLRSCDSCSEQLLRVRDNAAFLARLPRRTESAAVGVVESIEGFEILGEIHRGGQGIVYRAVQTATKRTVALKLLLQGALATSRQRRRFDREVELVAAFQHPSIVTLHDSGVTHDGTKYFAMEHIEGVPLDRYVRDSIAAEGSSNALEGVLRLFAAVCEAVSYAHQRGVIHRDLKPANVLVDSAGRPHVLDFGLARSIAEQATGDDAVTHSGEFMGTPAYAAPEQVVGDPALIDVRTDVYSLGVILYEMLTGGFPYRVTGRIDEIVRAISEQD